jgi:exodeoxyribonuclease VII large subunit
VSRFFSFQNGKIAAFGDTYAIRNRLKEYGGRWSGEQKCWMLPQSPSVVADLLELGFRDNGGSPVSEETPAAAPIDARTVHTFSPPEMSVSQLCQCIRSALERLVPPQFWIVGELCEARNSRGHTWLEVADPHPTAQTLLSCPSPTDQKGQMKATASIGAVVWSGVLRRLAARAAPQELPLQVGLKVRLLAHAEFRPEGGRVQVVVDDVDLSYTQGQLALTREQILLELRRRGLLDRNRQSTLAAFPLRIALITADQSRARNDFLHELQTSGIGFQTILLDCRMQGEDTASDVCAALRWLSTGGRANGNDAIEVDAIVITRGGGSRMDLRWFDDIEIAKSIASAGKPVVTAIGHHEDVSVADAVAWRAEKTPTAAARFLVQKCLQSETEILARLARASHSALLRVEKTEQVLLDRVARVNHVALRRIVAAEQALVQASRQIGPLVLRRMDRERTRLEQSERLLRVFQHQFTKALERGYALVQTVGTDGSPNRLLRAEDFRQDNWPTAISVVMATQDGRHRLKLLAHVESISEETTER